MKFRYIDNLTVEPTEPNNDGVKTATKSSEESERENPAQTKPHYSLAEDELSQLTTVTRPHKENE